MRLNPGDTVRHFKGMRCKILHIAKHSETLEEYIVYQHLDGAHEVWVRPLDMFLAPVDKAKYPDVIQEFRFEKISVEKILKSDLP